MLALWCDRLFLPNFSLIFYGFLKFVEKLIRTTMLKLKLMSILLALFFAPLLLVGQTIYNTAQLKVVVKAGNEKRIPSTKYVFCTYRDGVLTFDANFSYSYMDVSIANVTTDYVVSNTITQESPNVFYSELGDLKIQCVVDDTYIYEGELELK